MKDTMVTKILPGYQIFEQFSVSITQGSIWLKLAQLFTRRCCLKILWMDGRTGDDDDNGR